LGEIGVSLKHPIATLADKAPNQKSNDTQGSSQVGSSHRPPARWRSLRFQKLDGEINQHDICDQDGDQVS
jgi:hypothetical protein